MNDRNEVEQSPRPLYTVAPSEMASNRVTWSLYMGLYWMMRGVELTFEKVILPLFAHLGEFCSSIAHLAGRKP